jgi:ligand-binding sensor domain-containing protein
VHAIAGDSQGRVWFATAGGAAAFTPDPSAYALGAYDRGRWHTFAGATSPLVHESVHAILEDGRGRLWFATRGGISVLDESAPPDQRWRRFTAGGSAGGGAPTGLPHPWVQSLAIGPDGRVWAGTRGGLAVYDPARPQQGWTSYRAHPLRRWTGYVWPSHRQYSLLSDDVTALAWIP